MGEGSTYCVVVVPSSQLSHHFSLFDECLDDWLTVLVEYLREILDLAVILRFLFLLFLVKFCHDFC